MADVRKFVGADKALAQLRKLKGFTPNEFEKAQVQETLIEVTECKKVTPYKTGALRASIHMEGPERAGRSVKTFIVAGGPSLDYALIVHENLDAYHEHGQAKYIEGPLKEAAPFLAARIAARIQLNKGI